MLKYIIPFVLVCGVVLPVWALNNLQNPIDISSDELEVLQNQQEATFIGNVRVKHGEVTLGANRLKVFYQEGGDEDIREVIATGKVVIVHGENTASGEKAVYNPATGKILMQGGVVMSRGENVLTGNSLTYDVATGQMSLGDSNQGGRVKATFSLKGKNKGE